MKVGELRVMLTAHRTVLCMSIKRSRSLRVTLLAVAGLAMIAGAVGWYALSEQSISTRSIADCPTVEKSSVEQLAECVVDAALSIADSSGEPRTALIAVSVALDERPDIKQGCHRLGHDLGIAFYERYSSAAEVPGHRWCDWGYYHGILQKVATLDRSELVPYSERLCDRLIDSLTSESLCLNAIAHGVGHALAFVNSSTLDALRECEALQGFDSTSCAFGVVMEDSEFSETPLQLSAQECSSLERNEIRMGCVTGLVGYVAGEGESFETACGFYRNGTLFEQCASGFGSAVASKVHVPGSALRSDQIAACATNRSCATAFGSATGSWFDDTAKGESACALFFTSNSLDFCRVGVSLRQR